MLLCHCRVAKPGTNKQLMGRNSLVIVKPYCPLFLEYIHEHMKLPLNCLNKTGSQLIHENRKHCFEHSEIKLNVKPRRILLHYILLVLLELQPVKIKECSFNSFIRETFLVCNICDYFSFSELCGTSASNVLVTIEQALCFYQDLNPSLFTDHSVILGKSYSPTFLNKSL